MSGRSRGTSILPITRTRDTIKSVTEEYVCPMEQSLAETPLIFKIREEETVDQTTEEGILRMNKILYKVTY
jgi:hypothetical protein